MTGWRPSLRQGIGITGFAIVFLLLAGVAIWRSDILQAGLDPEVPFQTYDPPPAPDYRSPTAWALLEAHLPGAGEAAIFFIHSTTYDGGADWLAPIGHDAADAHLFRVVLPNYAGPFARAGAISAPRYRQASLYSRLTLRDDAREARAYAYRDIEAAFTVWLARNPTGPLVLAGVEQGGELLDRLVREQSARDPTLSRRLVAVYIVDALVAAERLPASVPACADRTQTGCIVGWSQVSFSNDGAVGRRLRRALVWDDRGHLVNLAGRRPLCVNPVSGAHDERRVSERQHLGAANATGLEWGLRPAFLDRLVATQCQDGLLRHDQPTSESFGEGSGWSNRRKARPYHLFYADIEADVMIRLQRWRTLNPRSPLPSASQTALPELGWPARVG